MVVRKWMARVFPRAEEYNPGQKERGVRKKRKRLKGKKKRGEMAFKIVVVVFLSDKKRGREKQLLVLRF